MATIHADPEKIKTYETDNRGRLNLGTDYANQEVEIAVLSEPENE